MLRSVRRTATETPSIVLLGARGTGKSSLATITASSLGLKHIDGDDFFLQQTGLTRQEFENRESDDSQRAEGLTVVFKTLLDTHSEGCIIVWPSNFLVRAAILLLQSFALAHPVVHIIRTTSAIEAYLKVPDVNRFRRNLDVKKRVYDVCTNLEFYNLEGGLTTSSAASNTADEEAHDRLELSSPSLRLKRIEQSFLRFLTEIFRPRPQVGFRDHISPLPQSRSEYSYLLQTSHAQVNSEGFKPAWLDCGADFCQLDVDLVQPYDRKPTAAWMEGVTRAFAVVARYFDGPIVYHVRLPSDAPTPESAALDRYWDLLVHGCRLGADFMVVDLRLDPQKISDLKLVPTCPKLIGEYHDAKPDFDGWHHGRRWGMYRKACDIQLHGVRLTQPAIDMSDNNAAMLFSHKASAEKPQEMLLIAYNTEALGRPSRCFNKTLTPITINEPQKDGPDNTTFESANAELSIQDCLKALYSTFHYDPMQYLAATSDTSSDVAPSIHKAFNQYFGLPHTITIQHMQSVEELEKFVNNTLLGGISVAGGLKRSVFKVASNVSVHAERIGAINTLVPIRSRFAESEPPDSFWRSRNRSGKILGLHGDNTDWIGISRCIVNNLSPANNISPRTTALVVGAGMMARAALYALMNLGVLHNVVYNRTPAHAHALVKSLAELKCEPKNIGPWPSFVDTQQQNAKMGSPEIRVLETSNMEWFGDLNPPTIVVCCLPPLGVGGQLGTEFALPLQWMDNPTGGIVVDLCYQPLVTRLIKQVLGLSYKGWVAVDGIEILCSSVVAQYELFTGRKVPSNVASLKALESLGMGPGDDKITQMYIQNKSSRLLDPVHG